MRSQQDVVLFLFSLLPPPFSRSKASLAISLSISLLFDFFLKEVGAAFRPALPYFPSSIPISFFSFFVVSYSFSISMSNGKSVESPRLPHPPLSSYWKLLSSLLCFPPINMGPSPPVPPSLCISYQSSVTLPIIPPPHKIQAWITVRFLASLAFNLSITAYTFSPPPTPFLRKR